MRILLELQDGSVIVRERTSDWTPLVGSLGVKWFGRYPACAPVNGARVSDPGGVYFRKLTIDLGRDLPKPTIMPRVGHAVGWGPGDTHETILYGIGADYIEPQGVRVIRWNHPADKPMVRTRHPFLACPDSLTHLKAQYDALAERIEAALRTGVVDPAIGLRNLCGPEMPLGEEIGYSYGGEGISAFGGYHRSYRYAQLAHDLTMARMPIAYVDMATGEPIIEQRAEYAPTRGPNKVQHRSEFVAPIDPSNQYNDTVIARDWNTGACEYRDRLVGRLARYPDGYAYRQGGYDPIDPDHLVRATSHCKALAFGWDDPVAMYCLRLIGADAWASWKPVAVKRGDGSPSLGRGAAWTLDVVTAAGMAAQRDLMCRSIDAAQMSCGAWYREEREGAESRGHSPDQYLQLGMPAKYGSTNAGQTAYMALARMQAAEAQLDHNAMLRAAIPIRAFAKMRPTPYLWVAVSENGVPLTDMKSIPLALDGKPTFEIHQLWGAYGLLGRLDPSFRREYTNLFAPDALAPCGPDVRGALLRSGYWDAVACALESLEK